MSIKKSRHMDVIRNTSIIYFGISLIKSFLNLIFSDFLKILINLLEKKS